MTNPQQSRLAEAPACTQELRAGRIVRLGRHGGEVRVLAGRIWLTLPDDLSDHLLAAGETFRVDHDGPTLVEAWDGAAPALFAWRPRSLAERTREALWRGAAVLHNARAAAGAALRPHRPDDSDQRQRPHDPARQARGCAAGAA